MQITAAMVKDLRARTGAGMMECKKFLIEASGDAELAIDLLRKSGQVKAGKKAGRIAAEGAVQIATSGGKSVILEINCETDFVARDNQFVEFADAIANTILESTPQSVEQLSGLSLVGGSMSVEEKRQELITKIGENIQVRRFECVDMQGDVAESYIHSGKIGVLVDMRGGDKSLAKDIAMHIAATNPECVSEAEVPAALLEKEKEILSEQAATSGKPADIIEKMVVGRLKKFLGEITLVGQAFVKDPAKTVAALLKENNAEVLAFYRYEVGEGIEKKQENFAEEVMAQVSQSEA